jgi:uncharacterized membrane protein YheB (UPF0754 family)
MFLGIGTIMTHDQIVAVNRAYTRALTANRLELLRQKNEEVRKILQELLAKNYESGTDRKI